LFLGLPTVQGNFIPALTEPLKQTRLRRGPGYDRGNKFPKLIVGLHLSHADLLLLRVLANNPDKNFHVVGAPVLFEFTGLLHPEMNKDFTFRFVSWPP
jgi:hypothetical protein